MCVFYLRPIQTFPLTARHADYDARRDPTAPSNLLAMSPGEMHTKRRRLWNRGLSNESLKEYERVIASRAKDLADGLERQQTVVDFVAWINFFA